MADLGRKPLCACLFPADEVQTGQLPSLPRRHHTSSSSISTTTTTTSSASPGTRLQVVPRILARKALPVCRRGSEKHSTFLSITSPVVLPCNVPARRIPPLSAAESLLALLPPRDTLGLPRSWIVIIPGAAGCCYSLSPHPMCFQIWTWPQNMASSTQARLLLATHPSLLRCRRVNISVFWAMARTVDIMLQCCSLHTNSTLMRIVTRSLPNCRPGKATPNHTGLRQVQPVRHPRHPSFREVRNRRHGMAIS